ncbi:hypothetical protein RR48_06225 [Papilio machaon]|uniref:Uncharacterized protein n=1 Tax=Papilio machaon TaxID=76193 RepID=A0A194QTE5_PAPMA|nr:hypothetical protein RR48_06225 [Papilio machaon]
MAQLSVRGSGVRFARLVLRKDSQVTTHPSTLRLPFIVMRYLTKDSYESFIMECDNDFEFSRFTSEKLSFGYFDNYKNPPK